MLDKDAVRRIIAGMQDNGYKACLRDIAYVLLCMHIGDRQLAYLAAFGENMDSGKVADYSEADRMYTLSKLIREEIGKAYEVKQNPDDRKDEDGKPDGMSYDEVKAGLEDDLRRLIAIRDNMKDDADPREAATIAGRIADIRMKLVERFGTQSKSEEGRIVVLQKFNDICPYCHREIAVRKR